MFFVGNKKAETESYKPNSVDYPENRVKLQPFI